MSILTPIFNLFKLQKSDPYAISQFNENMDIIDTEMAKPPLTVNGISPDPETRDLEVTTVPLADNLTSEEAQINTGTYVIRTSGGEASIAAGAAMLSDIKGGMIKTGYVAESIQMSVTQADPSTEDPISATLDHDTFIEAASTSGTYTFLYSNAWSVDPATYGITVTGTPVAGDKIDVVYVKLNRGTITTASPTSFVSTGWNLYNHAAGYARVVDYSSEYGFMIEGTYTALKFSETLSGEQTTITPVNGYFTVPSDGYVFVTGGNDTDTEIWMTWSDWTEEANGGVFEPYTQTSVDLSGVMVNFPDGLMKIGNVYDEINLNIGRAYSRIEKMEYTEANLEAVIASGVPYDTDTGYIYAVRVSPVTYTISLDGEYTVSDHGVEMFLGTSVDLTASSVYGNDLKGKLRRDVVTISQQTLTSTQQAQVLHNIGAASQTDVTALNSKMPTSNAFDEILILAGSDLNNYRTPGTFIVPNDSVASQISNMPYSASGRLIVMNRTTSFYMVQEYYPTSSAPTKYVRNYNNGTWTNWDQIALSNKNTYSITLNSGWSASTNEVVKIGKVCILQVNQLKTTTTSSGWVKAGTLDANVQPSGRIWGYFACDTSLSAGKTSVAEVRVNTDRSVEIYSPQANEAYWGGFAYFCY
jgi:hypothetical protein